MVQGFESSVDTYACIVDVCSPSGKPAGICSMNCRLWYFFTQIFYFWVFILKKFQQNKISTWAQTCVRSLTLQQFLNSSCPRTEFCECGWERITSVVSLTSSWNLSFLLQLWMWATNHSNASSTSDFITNRVQVFSCHNCCRNLEVSFIFIITLKFTEVIRPTFRSYLVGK